MNSLENAIQLLSRLIQTPSLSRGEDATASILEQYLRDNGVANVRRQHNNIWALSERFNPSLPILMLNSHHDTVRPAASYTRDPYSAEIADGRLYGLGSNDAGGSLVSLLHTFLRHYRSPLPFNLLLAMTAEEECMGDRGMRAFLPMLEAEGLRPDMAIVGEPTSMQPAIAERGLIVLDCTSHGITGHAARAEGVNAIYKAMADIERLRNFRFEKCSPVLGEISLQVTQIEAGRQHNVVPDECRFVVDVRTTDAYTNQQTAEILRQAIEADAVPRSTRVQASVIAETHPLVKAAVGLGLKPFVSPTTSDRAVMHGLPSLKIGPGESSRSHSADEFILIDEIARGLEIYDKIITSLTLTPQE